MELTISERFAALGVLPPKANLISLRLIQEMQDKLGFSADETKEFGLVSAVGPDGQAGTRWSDEHATTVRDIPLAPAELQLLKTEMAKLDNAAALTLSCISLYDKVHGDGKKPPE